MNIGSYDKSIIFVFVQNNWNIKSGEKSKQAFT